MRVARAGRAATLAAILALALGAAGNARAIQLTLVGDERLNQFGSGLPGTDYQTAPGGVDYDQIGSPDPHPGVAVVTGTIPSLNYHTVGPNVNFDFSPDLVFTLQAELISATITPLGAGARVTFEFQGVGPGPDLVIVDPMDGTTVLEADLVSGILNPTTTPSPVAALTVQLQIPDALNPPQNVLAQSFAFFSVRPSLYSSLFADGLGGFDVTLGTGTITNFEVDADGTFDFDDIFNAFIALPSPGGTEQLISSTSEANGQVFALASSQFQVPAPGAALLLGLGLVALAARRGVKS